MQCYYNIILQRDIIVFALAALSWGGLKERGVWVLAKGSSCVSPLKTDEVQGLLTFTLIEWHASILYAAL